MAAFTLPLPPSSNALVRPVVLGYVNGKPRVRLVATKAARKFREAAHQYLPVAPLEGPLEVYVTFYVPSISSDCSNRIKSLEDACNGRLWLDDCQVAELHVMKVIADGPDGVGVVIEARAANAADHPELAERLAKSAIQRRANEARQPELLLGNTTDGEITVNSHRLSKLPEPLREKLERLAKPAVYRPGEEPPR